MNSFPTYGLLALSLGGIFAAGGTVGYFMGQRAALPEPVAAVIGTASGASPQQWAEQAFTRLAGDLQLTEDQQAQVKPYLAAAADRVFLERDRALLQMHLRLLEVHDTIARGTALDEAQNKRLAQSRAKLKASILSRFAAILPNEAGALPDL